MMSCRSISMFTLYPVPEGRPACLPVAWRGRNTAPHVAYLCGDGRYHTCHHGGLLPHPFALRYLAGLCHCTPPAAAARLAMPPPPIPTGSLRTFSGMD